MFPQTCMGDAGVVVGGCVVVRWCWCRRGRDWRWEVVECVGVVERRVAVSERLRALGGDWRRAAATGQGRAASQGRSKPERAASKQSGVPRRKAASRGEEGQTPANSKRQRRWKAVPDDLPIDNAG